MQLPTRRVAPPKDFLDVLRGGARASVQDALLVTAPDGRCRPDAGSVREALGALGHIDHQHPTAYPLKVALNGN